MKRLTRLIAFIGVMFISANIYAGEMSLSQVYTAELPKVVNDLEEYEEAMCLYRNRDYCILTICSHSEDLNCHQKCEKVAVERCEERIRYW